MSIPGDGRRQLVNISLAPPPCCSMQPFVVCVGCEWKACTGHWYDRDETTMMDGFHIPTKPTADPAADTNIGICLRCGSEDWRKYG